MPFREMRAEFVLDIRRESLKEKVLFEMRTHIRKLELLTFLEPREGENIFGGDQKLFGLVEFYFVAVLESSRPFKKNWSGRKFGPWCLYKHETFLYFIITTKNNILK